MAKKTTKKTTTKTIKKTKTTAKQTGQSDQAMIDTMAANLADKTGKTMKQ